jgi:thiol-disulfide isomerase/thioredoxin
MLARLLIAGVVVVVSFAAYAAWKRPPRKLGRLSLTDLGLTGPAIVQFSTRNCAPCHVARPKLIEAAERASVQYAQIELDERPEVANRYGIRTVPTIVVTGPRGQVLGVWTRLPENGEILETARRAHAA